MPTNRAFTLVELMVATASVAVVVGLVFLVIHARAASQRALCLNNLRQIDSCIQMYLNDQAGGSLDNVVKSHSAFFSWTGYRQIIGRYAGLGNQMSPKDKLFACPADQFFNGRNLNGQGRIPLPMHTQADYDFTSYGFNPKLLRRPSDTNSPARAAQRLENLPHAAQAVLVAEMPAFLPFSWHESRPPSRANARYNDSQNVIAFADGHASYSKIYYDGKKIAWAYNPPAGYDYQWSGD